MPDITMCKGEGCPKKEYCYRYTALASPYRQYYFILAPYDLYKEECEVFMDNGLFEARHANTKPVSKVAEGK